MLQLLKDIWYIRSLRRRLEWHEDFVAQLTLAKGKDENVVLLLPGHHRVTDVDLPSTRAIFVTNGAYLYMAGCTFGVYPSELHSETEIGPRLSDVP